MPASKKARPRVRVVYEDSSEDSLKYAYRFLAKKLVEEHRRKCVPRSTSE